MYHKNFKQSSGLYATDLRTSLNISQKAISIYLTVIHVIFALNLLGSSKMSGYDHADRCFCFFCLAVAPIPEI